MADPKRQEIASLYAQFGAMVHRRAYVLLGSDADAEDATQEVFARVIKHLHRHRGEASLTTWLYRVTTNHCLNVLRNRNRRRRLLKDHYQDVEPIDCVPSPQDLVATRQLLSTADKKQAMAAVYVLVDGMTRSEAAEALGVSERTVYNLLQRFVHWAQSSLDSQAPSCRNLSTRVSRIAGVASDS